MYRLLFTMSLAALLVGLPFASAQAPQVEAEQLFAQLDSNKDGRLSLAELTAHPGMTAETFKAYDADGDKSISKAEFVAQYGK